MGVGAVDAAPDGGGDVPAGGRPADRLLFSGAGGTAMDGLSLYTYPCVMSCPVSFCLFAVYVRFLLISLLVKFLFSEDDDILPREPLNELGKFLSCAYKCMPLLGMIRN